MGCSACRVAGETGKWARGCIARLRLEAITSHSNDAKHQRHVADQQAKVAAAEKQREDENATAAFGKVAAFSSVAPRRVRGDLFFEENQDVAVVCLALVPFAWRWAVVRTCRLFRGLVGSQKFASVRATTREEVLIVTTWGRSPQMLLNGRWHRGPEVPITVGVGLPCCEDSIVLLDRDEDPAAAVFNASTLTWHDVPSGPLRRGTVFALGDPCLFALNSGDAVARLQLDVPPTQWQWRQDHDSKLGDLQSTHYILYLSQPMNRKLYCVSRRRAAWHTFVLHVYDLDANEWTDHGEVPFADAAEGQMFAQMFAQWCTVALGAVVSFFINDYDEIRDRERCRVFLWHTDTLSWSSLKTPWELTDCHFKPTIYHDHIVALSSNQHDDRRLWRVDLGESPSRGTSSGLPETEGVFHALSDVPPFPLSMASDGSPLLNWVGYLCTVAL